MELLLSDVHGNLEALTCVLDFARSARVERIICLGDIIGFGPDSIPCLRLLADVADLSVVGDWEHYLVAGPGRLEPVLPQHRRLINRIQRDLQQTPDADRLIEFVQQMPTVERDGNNVYCHATPDSAMEFIFPEDQFNESKMLDLFQRLNGNIVFAGHTHVAGVFSQSGKVVSYQSQQEIGETWFELTPTIVVPSGLGGPTP